MVIKITTPGRVLVKEVNWLGDAVMSLPSLRAIRAAWPNSHLAVLVKSELAGFFDGARWIDEIIPYTLAEGIAGLRDTARIVSRIRAGQFDLAVLFPNSFSSAMWMVLGGVPKRAGYIRYRRGTLLTHKAEVPPEAAQAHHTSYWPRMLAACLGIEADAQEPVVDVHEPHREKMRNWLAAHGHDRSRPLVALAPSAAYGPAKEWPADRYSDVIRALSDRFDANCVLVGSPADRDKSRRIVEGAKRNALIAVGETSVGELIAMLSLCDGFIGNDSGCAHVAAALGVPTVAIFGSTDPRRTGPRGPKTEIIYRALPCSPCLQRICPLGHTNCLVAIDSAEAVAALDRLGAFNRASEWKTA